MSQVEREQNIERILVALDSSPSSLAALEAAAELAASFKAQLLGLFVEDINLLRMAQISFTQEVGLFSGTSRRIEIRHVERQFRSQAGQARQALAAIANQAQVDWSFRVARGAIAAELLEAASEADLIILGRVGWSPLGRRRLGSTTRTVLAQGTQLTLILQHGMRLSGPVLLLYDGSAAAQKSLAIMVRLMQERESELTVLILADEPERAHGLRQDIEATLAGRGLAARFLWQSKTEAQSLIHTIQRTGCRTLVVPGNDSFLEHELILTLIDQIACPVFVVR